MPIYEYKCLKCKHQFEVIQKFSDNPVENCPECNKKSVQKLVSAPSFRLKGGGWYETDFKTGSKKTLRMKNLKSPKNKLKLLKNLKVKVQIKKLKQER
jgi:putative FmdB family regulatory protein